MYERIDKFRWRYGDTNPVVAAVPRKTQICIGDMLFLDKGFGKPVSDETDINVVMDGFLGVAMQRSRVGEDDEIRVATTGVFEMDCDRQCFEIGDLVGLVLRTPQFVMRETMSRRAIGRVARRAPELVASVLVDVVSVVMRGGIHHRPNRESLI